MSPEQKAKILGMTRHPENEMWRERWLDASFHMAIYKDRDPCWRVAGENVTDYPTEEAALSAYIAAAGPLAARVIELAGLLGEARPIMMPAYDHEIDLCKRIDAALAGGAS